MTETLLKCPNCGHPIPIEEALAAQVRGEVEAELRAREAERIADAVKGAEARAREADRARHQQHRRHVRRDARIVGASLPEIPALALVGAAGLLEGGK